MAIENKRLQFILDMVDKVTGPSQKVTQSLKGLGDKVTETQKQISSLDKQAEDIKGLQKMRQESTRNAAKAKDLTANIHKSEKAYELSKLAQAAASKELQKGERALKKATLTQGQSSHVVTMHQRRVETLRKVYQEAKETTAKHKAETSSLTKELSVHTTKTEHQKRALEGVETKLKAAGVNTGMLAMELKRVTDAQTRANAALQQHQRDLDSATRKQEQYTAAKERYNKVSKQAEAAMKLGGKVMAGGAAITATSVLAAAPYRAFDAQMSAVQATGGMDDAAKERLAKLARHEAKTSSFGATEAAQAQEYLAMAGFDEKAITASLRGVMDLAVATKTGLAETADIGSNILSGFGLDADQMARVGDVLTKTTTTSNTNLTELGETMKYVAGVSKTAGYSLESTAAAAGLMANAGIKGSQAGTALRAAILRMGSLPKAAQKAFDSLGVATTDAKGNLRGLEYVLADVAKAMEGMGTGEKIKKLSGMFGAEAAAGLAELLDKSSGDEMFAYIKKLEQAQGATAKAAKTRAANLDGDLKQLYSGIEEVRLKYGEGLDKMYRGIVIFATNAIAKLDEWMAAHPGVVKALGLVSAALGVLLAASGALLVGLGALWLMMAKLRLTAFLLRWAFAGWMKSILGVIASVSLLVAKLAIKTAAIALSVTWWAASRSAMLAWVVVCNAVKVAMAALNIVFRLSPLGWLVTAVMALAAAGVWLWKNWDNLPEAFDKLWADICGYFGKAWDYIKELLGFDPLAILGEVWAGVVAFFDGVVDGIKSKFSGMFDSIISGFKSLAAMVGIDLSPEVDATIKTTKQTEEKTSGFTGWAKEKANWALGGFGYFDNEEKNEAIKDAPKKEPETGKVEQPKEMRKGGQIKQESRTVHYAPTVAPVFHVTQQPGEDGETFARRVNALIEESQRRQEQKTRGRLFD